MIYYPLALVALAAHHVNAAPTFIVAPPTSPPGPQSVGPVDTQVISPEVVGAQGPQVAGLQAIDNNDAYRRDPDEPATTEINQPPVGISFINQYPGTIYLSGDWAAKDDPTKIKDLDLESLDRTLDPGVTTMYSGFALASPKFMVSTTPNGLDTGDKRTHDTAVEITWAGFAGHTYYDVDVERGTSVPIWCHGATQTWEQGQGCIGHVLEDCPDHLVRVSNETGARDQCAGENTPSDVARRRKLCPSAYVEAADNRTNTMADGHELKCFILHPDKTDPHP